MHLNCTEQAYVVIVVELYMMKSKNLYPKTMPLLQRDCNVKNS